MKKTKLALHQKLMLRKDQISTLTAGEQSHLAGGSTMGPHCPSGPPTNFTCATCRMTCMETVCQAQCVETNSCAPAVCESTACPPTQ